MPVTPATLVDTYRRIAAERMSALPFLNPALQVEAVGFRPWETHQVGVLITPWFMNLVLIPGPEREWRDYSGDKPTEWAFPGGRCAFHASRPDGEVLHMCASLFTTVEGFPDQDTAREVAAEVLRNLFAGSAGGRRESAHRGGAADALLAKPLSRRGFFSRFSLPED